MAFSGPATFSLLSDLFPPQHKTKMFFVYSILSQLGDTITLLTLQVIRLFGWKMTFKICGGFGMVSGLLGLFFFIEPMREQDWKKIVNKWKAENDMSLTVAQ